ncbi:MAG: hypothetical protein BWZ07_03210 [Alphaproteobacteria bacterium ADurb.BinA280]|nr:MAG: hypothetical protein BWZ07_03210 [Alphaproteobacteria bacterium ADurb.BinA280]
MGAGGFVLSQDSVALAMDLLTTRHIGQQHRLRGDQCLGVVDTLSRTATHVNGAFVRRHECLQQTRFSAGNIAMKRHVQAPAACPFVQLGQLVTPRRGVGSHCLQLRQSALNGLAIQDLGWRDTLLGRCEQNPQQHRPDACQHGHQQSCQPLQPARQGLQLRPKRQQLSPNLQQEVATH